MVRLFHIVFWVLMLAGTGFAQQRETVRIVQGSAVTLRADAAGAVSFLWFRNGEPINGFHDQRLRVSEAGIYTVMAIGEGCDSDLSAPVEVIVDPGGEPITVDMAINNEPDRPAVLVGDAFTYQLLAINNGNGTAHNVAVNVVLPQQVTYDNILGTYTGEVSYDAASRELTWRPGDIAPGQSVSITISVRAENEGMASQLAVITNDQTDSNLDDNEDTAVVEIIALNIPNVFTPNGDGLNDYFVIPRLDLFTENRLLLFNRWGNELFKTTDYQNDWNGNGLAEGTYYYVLELKAPNGRWETFKGFVTLIRNTNN
ncbi:gliding motility-associated C-terminal domain-containing protein [Parapedobacter sp. DT-150]|uniref:T9SS type B sorting domain-containing protein n=1 Tax=Parapedobacter sp. DT-150 TaxID=3396162 RepID=UPI003F1C57DE